MAMKLFFGSGGLWRLCVDRRRLNGSVFTYGLIAVSELRVVELADEYFQDSAQGDPDFE